MNLLDAYALEWDDCMFYNVQFSCFFLFDVRLIELDDAVVGEGGVILASDSMRFEYQCLCQHQILVECQHFHCSRFHCHHCGHPHKSLD